MTTCAIIRWHADRFGWFEAYDYLGGNWGVGWRMVQRWQHNVCDDNHWWLWAYKGLNEVQTLIGG